MSDSWIKRGHASYVWRFGQDRRLDLIRRYVELEGRWILDVGCGIGTYVEKFGRFSDHVYGIDIEEDRVRQGVKRGLRLAVSVAERLPFDDNAFEVVLLNEVIEHGADDRQTVSEALRVLRPGGALVIYAPNRLYPFETHGAYFGRRFVFGLIPLVNYLPDRLRDLFCPHVRAYCRSDVRRLFEGLPASIQVHSYVYPGFDNIHYRRPLLAKVLRTVFYTLESTPLRMFGLSHFLVVRKIYETGPLDKNEGRPKKAQAEVASAG